LYLETVRRRFRTVFQISVW